MEFNKLYKNIITEADQSELLNQMVNKQGQEDEETPEDTENIEPEDDSTETETDDEDTNDDQDKKKEEQDKKQQKDEERLERLKKYVNEVISDIKFQVDKNPKIILNDFRVYGPDETIKRFIENIFIPHIKDSDEKIFLTLNIEEFTNLVSEKLSDKFLQVK